MTFPTVEATNTSYENSATTTHTISLPASVGSGDLLIAILSLDGTDADASWPGSWSELIDLTSAGNRISIGYLIATGGESTVQVTTDNSRKSSHVSFRISGHKVQAPDISSGATGSGSTPDPDSLTPAGGADDLLWIAIAGADSEHDFTAWPTNYSNNQLEVNSSSGSFGSSAAAATRELNDTSDDPGTFTHDGSDQWAAVTIAVYPSAAAGAMPMAAHHYRMRRA